MDPSSLARALDARIDGQRRAGRAALGKADAMPAGEADTAGYETLAELTELAAALDELPKMPAPEAAFRASLAERLAHAPAPSTVHAPAAPESSPRATATASAAVEPGWVLSTGQLSQAFDASLVALSAGVAREDVLAMLGEAAGDGDLTDLVGLAATLYELPDVPSPRASFRMQLRDVLAAAPEPRSLRHAARPTLWSRLGLHVWQSTKAMAGVAAAFILFAGAGVTFASANALPGDALYPVKRTTERAQLWLGGPADALHHHLSFADRRLDEAVARPPLAGMTLAEFNREVTAALASADEAVARQVPRDRVIEPLLRWLLGARHDLVVGRPVLPPMAWRGARALVDEAILALDGGRPLAERAVPRLAHADAVLALRADDAQPWTRLLPATTDLGVGAALPATLPAKSPAVPDVRVRAAGSGSDAAAPRAPSALVASAPPTGPGAATGPSSGTVLVEPRDTIPLFTTPRDTNPRPTSRPSKPTATERSATAEPTIERPSPTRDVPTEPPPAPTEPPAVDPTPTAVTPAPTEPPAATPTSQPALPADLVLSCGRGGGEVVVEVFQTVACTLRLPDGWTLPEGWVIRWTTTSLNPPEDPELEQDDERSPSARYTPKIALAGLIKMVVHLDATVRDGEDRPQAVGKATLFVVPRNHGTNDAAPSEARP